MRGSLETSGCMEVSKLRDARKFRNFGMHGSFETSGCMEVSKLRDARKFRSCLRIGVPKRSRACGGPTVADVQCRFGIPSILQFRDFQASGDFETSSASCSFETSKHLAASRLPCIKTSRDFHASIRSDRPPFIPTVGGSPLCQSSIPFPVRRCLIRSRSRWRSSGVSSRSRRRERGGQS